MKTSLLDKTVAIGVVATTLLGLIALWAPRLDAVTTGDAPFANLPPAGPALFYVPGSAECATVRGPAPRAEGRAVPARPAARGIWL